MIFISMTSNMITMFNETTSLVNFVFNFAWGVWYGVILWSLIKVLGFISSLISDFIINYNTIEIQEGIKKLLRNGMPQRCFRMIWMIDIADGHLFKISEETNTIENTINVIYKTVGLMQFVKNLSIIGYFEDQVSLVPKNRQNYRHLKFRHLKKYTIELFSNSISLLSIPILCDQVDHLSLTVPTITKDCLAFIRKSRKVTEIQLKGLFESRAIVTDLIDVIGALPLLLEVHLPYHKSMRPMHILETVTNTKVLSLMVIHFDDNQLDSVNIVNEKFIDAHKTISTGNGVNRSVITVNATKSAVLISRYPITRHVMATVINDN